MKQRWSIFLALSMILWSCAVFAQNMPSALDQVYKVGDVPVDVTADSAVKARDQAIANAQRSAFGMLLERLGADANVGAKLSNNDLMTLVKNFEVSNEKTSSVRYIGSFAVQFRPTAVRNFLTSRHTAFSDTPGSPIIVVPVMRNGYQAILWEEQTRWYKAWTVAAKAGGIVPIIVPAGTPDDQNMINARDAIAGKVESIKSLVDTYHSDGAVVAVLNGSFDTPAAGFTIDLQRFGTGFDAGSDIEHIAVVGTTDKNAIDGILIQNIKQIRKAIEKEQREEHKHNQTQVATDVTDPSQQPVTVWSDEAPAARMPVTVQFATLAEWADIQRRLLASAGVQRVDVTSLGRGVTEIELGFTGSPDDIRAAVAQHGLRLSQDVLSGRWMLKGS